MQYTRKGRTPAEIAKDCHCTEQTIWNWLNKFGLVK